ncbi:MAG: AAA family ATPase [Elusimicrobia bacterium]|nr:AAA family ATPase [Elusimicrobiota bacterium]
MYEEYWNLRELPFENTPDPKFFYASERHNEALSRLQYVVRQRKACGVLTGVYGCGKTLILHALRKSTEPEGCRFSVVNNPRLDDLGLLRFILRGLVGQEVPSDKADVLMALQTYIEGVAQDGKHTVIAVDEAHAIMSNEVFEELRLLLNFHTETRFLVTLLLAGQPELQPKVESNKQLNQRVNLHYHIDAFSAEDTTRYIKHRLSTAGDGGEEVFTPEAIDLLHRYSGGIPRWLNHFCHMSLLAAYTKNARHITPEIAEEAVQSVKGSV